MSTLLAVLLCGGCTWGQEWHSSRGEDRLELGDYFGLCVLIIGLQNLFCVVAAVTILPLAGAHLSVLGVFTFVVHGTVTSAALHDAEPGLHLRQFRQVATADVLGSVGGLGVTYWLTTGSTAAPAGFLGALAFGAALQAVLTFLMLEDRPRPRVATSAWRRTIRQGVSGTGIGVAQAATYRFDRYLVGLFATPTAAGLYSVAATGAELIRLVPSALGQIALRRTAQAGRVSENHTRTRAIAVGLTAAACLVSIVFAPWALRTALGARYEPAADALRLLLVAEVFTASFLIDSAVLAGKGRLRVASSISIIGFAVITLLDFAAIPRFGIAGAAVASIVAYAVMAGMAWWALNTPGAVQPPPGAGAGGSPDD